MKRRGKEKSKETRPCDLEDLDRQRGREGESEHILDTGVARRSCFSLSPNTLEGKNTI